MEDLIAFSDSVSQDSESNFRLYHGQPKSQPVLYSAATFNEAIQNCLEEATTDICDRCRSFKLDDIFREKHESILKGSFHHLFSLVDHEETDADCKFCEILEAALTKGLQELTLLLPVVEYGLTASPGVSSKKAVRLSIYFQGRTEIYLGKSFSSSLGPITVNPSSVNFNRLREQLAFCEDHHTACREQKRGIVPGMAVIDCSSRQLVFTPENCIYVALSYVWGPAALTSIEPVPINGFLPNGLDATIEDALKVTLEIGYKYIWIDRFCIGQQSPEMIQEQIESMDLIYKNAMITIIAAAGEDPTFGLPGMSIRGRHSRKTVRLGPCHIITSFRNLYSLVGSSKWMTRGWTYQEAVLSRRRLFFTEEQVFLECQSMGFPEACCLGSDILDREYKRLEREWVPIIPFRSKPDIWSIVNVIGQYTDRTLTYQSDAIRALLGVLGAYEEYGIYHHWGVPTLTPQGEEYEQAAKEILVQDGFVYGLCWTHLGVSVRKRPQFPSWSWAGWIGQVGYPYLSQTARLTMGSGVKVFVELDNREKLSWFEFQKRLQAKEARWAPIPSQLIWLEAWTIPVRIHDDDTVIFPVTGGEFYRWRCYTMPGSKKGGKLDGRGILLAPMSSNVWGPRYPFVILLQNKGEWWERVAHVLLQWSDMLEDTGVRRLFRKEGPKVLAWEKQLTRLG